MADQVLATVVAPVPAATALDVAPSSTPRAPRSSHTPTSRRASLTALLAIAFVPLAFIVATRGDWLLDFGGEDGWIYVKLFMVWGNPHADLREFLDTNYKAARVPWIIPGWLAYQVFGPLLATYLLHTAVLLGGALCIWLGVRRLFGDGAAVVTTLLILAYPGFQSSGITQFWNYHGQAAVAYYLLAMLAVVLARSARMPALWYGLAGAALVATVGTALTHVVLLPAFGVFALALLPRFTLRAILTALIGGAAGVVAGVALFGLANMLAGGPFHFFWPQVTATLEYTDATPELPFAEVYPIWFRSSRWIGFPPLLALASLVAIPPLARWRALGTQRWLVIGCLLQHLVAWAVLLLLEDRGQLIQVAFHYHLIVGPTVFALAALVWIGLRLDRRGLSTWSVAVLTLGLVLPQIALGEPARDQIRAALDLGRWLPVLPSDWWAYAVTLSAGLGLLVVGLRRRWLAITTVASVLLGVSCALNAVSASAFQPPAACSSVAQQYRLILDTAQWSVARQLDTNALIWFDPAATLDRGPGCPPIPMYPIFDAIQHATIVRLAAQPLPPRLDEASTDRLHQSIRARERMVLLSTPAGEAAAEEQFQAWLRRASVRGVAERSERFEARDGDVAVVLQVFQLRRR